MQRNESIQVLRAVAALLVVHIHCIFIMDSVPGAHPVHAWNIANFGACGVDIFFAISGFILSTVAMNTPPTQTGGPHRAGDFLLRRFIRIFPIYWVLSLFFVAVGIKQHYLTLPRFLHSYLLSPTFGVPIPMPLIFVGWTLIFEMFFYYLITLNLVFGSRRVVERTIASICVLVAAGSFAGFQRPVLILIANPLNIEFVLGCLIGLAYARFGKRQRLGTTLLCAGSLLLLVTFFAGNAQVGQADNVLNGSLSWYRVMVWGIPAAMITAGLVFRSAPIRSGAGRLGVELGNASYSIYLISPIVLYVYGRFYPPLAHLGPDVNIGISFAAVVVCGEVCYRTVERPLTRLLTARYHRPAVQSAP